MAGVLQHGEIDQTGGGEERGGQGAPFGAAFPEERGDHHRRQRGETGEGVADGDFKDALFGFEFERDDVSSERHDDDERAREMDCGFLPVFLPPAVVLVDVFGEHGAQRQHLVGIRAHDGGNNPGAEDARQPDRRIFLQHQQQYAVGIGHFAERGGAQDTEKDTWQPNQHNGEGVQNHGPPEGRHFPRRKAHDRHVREHDTRQRDQRVTPEGLGRHLFARHKEAGLGIAG